MTFDYFAYFKFNFCEVINSNFWSFFDNWLWFPVFFFYLFSQFFFIYSIKENFWLSCYLIFIDVAKIIVFK